MSAKRLIINLSIVVVVLAAALSATLWFQNKYVGWLLESVPNSLAFKHDWQMQIDRLSEVNHPAVVHVLPDDCLCRMFTLKHAQQVTETASGNGFNVYQLGSDDAGLGQVAQITGGEKTLVAPLVVITNKEGEIAYLGAYSDGIRCNTGTSMIESFIVDANLLPKQAVIGLDVESCRCID